MGKVSTKRFFNKVTNEWIGSILLAVILGILIKTFIFSFIVISGDSMFPTLKDGEKLVSNNLPVIFKNYKQGDIVSLVSPDGTNELYIKRIIATEGDVVKIKKGEVFVNNERLKETYTSSSYTDTYGIKEWEVPKGEVFVLGDNREEFASNDSRLFGTVPIKKLKGVASIRIKPLSQFGKINT